MPKWVLEQAKEAKKAFNSGMTIRKATKTYGIHLYNTNSVFDFFTCSSVPRLESYGLSRYVTACHGMTHYVTIFHVLSRINFLVCC
jgi:hypothetical protein